MLNLPPHREMLEEKVHHSLRSFADPKQKPVDELYTFVMENVEDNVVCGTSGIYSTIGVDKPHYLYRHEQVQRTSPKGDWTEEVLIPTAIENGPSEICGLYLQKDYRKGGIGRLLSLSRFLFMAQFLERFTETVIAEMRGISQNCDFCPFWNGVGRHFLDREFCEVLEMFMQDDSFVPSILPQYPIYVAMLPKYAQRVIGKPHPSTQPALNLLKREGFAPSKLVDIFDAGPVIEAKVKEVRSISESQLAPVGKLLDHEPRSERMVLSNTHLDFRACFGHVRMEEGSALLSATAAEALEIGVGDLVRYVPAHPDGSRSN